MKFLLASIFVTFLATYAAGTEPAADKVKPWESWDKFRVRMSQISEQLGVTCTYCHQPQNYRDSSKKEHEIAKKHMEMVDMLQKQFKDSTHEKVDCYICHRGSAKIDLKKKLVD